MTIACSPPHAAAQDEGRSRSLLDPAVEAAAVALGAGEVVGLGAEHHAALLRFLTDEALDTEEVGVAVRARVCVCARARTRVCACVRCCRFVDGRGA